MLLDSLAECKARGTNNATFPHNQFLATQFGPVILELWKTVRTPLGFHGGRRSAG